jgi:hypothetical protein
MCSRRQVLERIKKLNFEPKKEKGAVGRRIAQMHSDAFAAGVRVVPARIKAHQARLGGYSHLSTYLGSHCDKRSFNPF